MSDGLCLSVVPLKLPCLTRNCLDAAVRQGMVAFFNYFNDE